MADVEFAEAAQVSHLMSARSSLHASLTRSPAWDISLEAVWFRVVGANFRQVASSPPHPVNSVLTSGPDGGIRSAASFEPRGRFISSMGHSITRPVIRWISTLCRSSKTRKYVVSA